MAKLTMGTEAALALQAKIQAELAVRGYSSETDTVMAEYITIMVINDKTAEQINAELADLIGAEYDPSFTGWLFAETEKAIDPATQTGSSGASKEDASVTEEIQLNTSRRGSGGGVGLLQSALSGINPPTAPSALRQSTSPSAQKRTASARSPSPSTNGPNKTRRTDTPTGPRAMMERSERSSSSTSNNQGGRSLIDRVGGHARRGGFNTGHTGHGGLSQAQVSQIQAKIDGITGSQPNLMLTHPQAPMPMNGPPMNFTVQEMMMMNFDMMRQMANTIGMLAPNGMGGVSSMGGFGLPQQIPGFVPQMGMPSSQQGHGGMGRGGSHRGDGHGRGRGHANQFTIPTQDRSAASSAQSAVPATPASAPVAQSQSTSHQPAVQASTQGTGTPAVTDSSAPVRPATPSLCKFGLKCTNPQCRFSHPSPVATVESGVVLSTEFCPRGKDCKDKHCTLGHVSPSVLNGEINVIYMNNQLTVWVGAGPVSTKPVTHTPAIPSPSGVSTPCKFGVLCTRPGCIFTHPPNFRPSHHALSHQSTSTVPCRFGTSCTRSDCPFQHPKGHVPANMFYKGLGPDAPLVEAYVSPHRSVRFGDPKPTTTKDNGTKDDKVKETDGLSNDKVTEKTVDVGA